MPGGVTHSDDTDLECGSIGYQSRQWLLLCKGVPDLS